MEYGLKWHNKNNQSNKLVIFVHGLNSDNQAWSNDTTQTYWPDFLVLKKIHDPNIALFSYSTSIKSRNYSITDASNSLHEDLDNDDCFDFERIIFVCHSMGGIVVRNMLTKFEGDFANIAISLLLLGSPSTGSDYANLAKPISILTGQKQLKYLEKDNDWLIELNARFRNFMHNRVNAGFPILGKEFLEDKPPSFILPEVVKKSAGAIFFGREVKIDGSTHSSIAKPISANSKQHKRLLRMIYPENYSSPTSQAHHRSNNKGNSISEAIDESSNKKLILSFNSEYIVDSVSMQVALRRYEKNHELEFQVNWHDSLNSLKETLEKLLKEAEEYKENQSRFFNVNEEIVVNFVKYANDGLDRAEFFFRGANQRIPFLLDGMNNYWGGYIGDTEAEALKNYLILVGSEILRNLISPLRFEVVYDLFPKKFESWFSEKEKSPIFKSIFEISEPIHHLYLRSLGDQDFLTPPVRVSGPKQLIHSCDSISRKLDLSLVEKYIIPQNEFRLISSLERFKYSHVGSYTKILDENNQEV